MALAECRECDQQVSTEAASCPHCGATAPGKQLSREWILCPKCGSAKAQRFGPGAVAAASLLGAGCAFWIPVLGWMLIPFLLLIAVGAAVSAVLPTGKAGFHCQNCQNWFTVRKEELSR